VIVVLWLLCAACFYPCLHAPFVFDDTPIIADNPAIRSVRNLPLFLLPRYWKQIHPGTKGLYRPTREMLFTLVYAVAGPAPAAFHLVSLALHAVNVLLVYLIALRLVRGRWGPAIAGACFAIHPVHVEPVVWAKNAGDLLCAAFALAAAWLFLRRMPGPQQTRPRRLWWAPAIVAFALALLTKEAAVPLALLLFIHAGTASAKSRWRFDLRAVAARTAPLWVAAVLYLVFQVAFLSLGHSRMYGVRRSIRVRASLRFAMFAKTFTFYHRLLMYPAPLCAVHYFEHPVSLWEEGMPRSVALFFVIGGGVLAAAVLLPRHRTSILWASVMLGPSYNLIPYAGRPVGENRVYLPSVGVCLILGAILGWLLRQRKRTIASWGAAITAAVALCFVGGTLQRGHVWRSRRAFWSDALRSAPYWSEAYHALGALYWSAGDVGRAVPFFRTAVVFQDWYAPYRASLGLAYARTGQMALARHHLKAAAHLWRGRPRYYFMMAEVLRDPEALDKALSLSQNLTRVRPKDPGGWSFLGRCRLLRGRPKEAADALEKAVSLATADVGTRVFLADAYMALQRPTDAAAQLREAWRLEPGNPSVRQRMAALRGMPVR